MPALFHLLSAPSTTTPMNCRPFRLFLALSLGLSLSLHVASAQTAKGGKAAEAKTTESKGGAITDPKEVLAGIPREVLKDLRPGSKDSEAAVIKATAKTRENAEGKDGNFKMTVGYVEQFQRRDSPDVTRTRVRQNNEIIREGGATMRVFLAAALEETDKAKLSKINKGSKLTLTGKISNASIVTTKAEVELHIDLMDAKIE